MITDPILIIGAPRSGTSLLQKIIRESPGIWSLPSEGNEIWDEWCHPSMNNWDSEVMLAEDLLPEARNQIRNRFEQETLSYRVWRAMPDKAIWSMRRRPVTRSMLRKAYYTGIGFLPDGKKTPKRIVDKTASNCFRIGYIRAVFPDAKILYITRDGRNAVESLIRGWLHPTRFFTYSVPSPLNIEGYSGSMWNFILPPNWRAFTNRTLEEVCTFQWVSSNQFILENIANEIEGETLLTTRLEDLVANPIFETNRILSFVGLPSNVKNGTLPRVNASVEKRSTGEETGELKERIQKVAPQMEDMLSKLGYSI